MIPSLLRCGDNPLYITGNKDYNVCTLTMNDLMNKQTLFISDLHLCADRPHIFDLFNTFLTTQAIKADALYILGDLFEMWVGDDDLTEFHQKVIKSLADLSAKNIPIYLMVGNRDFLLSKRFFKATRCNRLPDPSCIDLYGRKILLMHGDSLCTDDMAHQRIRSVMHNELFKWVGTHLVPLAVRSRFGRYCRAKSQRDSALKTEAIMDVNAQTVKKVMQQFSVNVLIHGHTHRPAIHDITLNTLPAKRVVLPAWEQKAGVLIYDQAHHFSLQPIN